MSINAILINIEEEVAYAAGQVSLRALAAKYGVSHETIRAHMTRRGAMAFRRAPMTPEERSRAYADRLPKESQVITDLANAALALAAEWHEDFRPKIMTERWESMEAALKMFLAVIPAQGIGEKK